MFKDIVFDPQMTTYDMATLELLVEQRKPMHSLEIGSWKGLSSSIIARHSKVLYCVDTWQGAPDELHMVAEAQERSILKIFINNMNALDIRNVRPMLMTSAEARLTFKEDYLDFIFIDGDHTYDAVKLDLDWWGKLKVGGIMAGHDYDDNHPGVKKALEERFPGQFKVFEKSSIWYLEKGQA